MLDEVCEEKHKNIDAKLKEHDEILKEHEIKIDNLNQDGREFKISIQNLCDKIDSLVSTSKWLIGIGMTGIGGLFIWMLQGYLSK